jgi:hypothetical protein
MLMWEQLWFPIVYEITNLAPWRYIWRLAYELTNQTVQSLLQYFLDATRVGIPKIYQRVKSVIFRDKTLKIEEAGTVYVN